MILFSKRAGCRVFHLKHTVSRAANEMSKTIVKAFSKETGRAHRSHVRCHFDKSKVPIHVMSVNNAFSITDRNLLSTFSENQSLESFRSKP